MAVFERATKSVVNENMTNPGFAYCIMDTLEKLNTPGGFGDMGNAITQIYARDFTIYDAYPFHVVWQLIKSGNIFYGSIPVSDTPFGDSETDSNNKILGELAPETTAIFQGGPGDNDGNLSLNIEFSLIRDDQLIPYTFPPIEGVSLEVGYTKSWTTYAHLVSGRWLARWPYGQKQIWVFHLSHDMANQMQPQYPYPASLIEGLNNE